MLPGRLTQLQRGMTMNTKEAKTVLHRDKNHLDGSSVAGASSPNGSASDSDERAQQLHETMRKFGQNLLVRTKKLSDAAHRRAHLSPYALAGIAFMAGLVVARRLG
jgi:hypothetical protein